MYNLNKLLNIEPKDINEIVRNWFNYKNNLIWEVTYYYERSVESALTELYIIKQFLAVNKNKIQKCDIENHENFNIFEEINSAINYLKEYDKNEK